MLTDGFLSRTARLEPDRVALVTGADRFTYAALDTRVENLAAHLRGLGIRRGDRVVIHLENSAEAVTTIFGVSRAGAVFVPVSPSAKSDKLAYILNDSGAAALVTDNRSGEFVRGTVTRTPSVRVVIVVGQHPVSDAFGEMVPVVPFDQLSTSAEAAATESVIDVDLAALIYTSGSTGYPKGVMLTHENIVAATTSIGKYLQNTSDDVILNVLPLSFDYGLYQAFLAFSVSARLVLERSFTYPTVMLDRLVRERVTAFPIVPMIAALLLKHDLRRYDLSALRYVTNTGAVLPPAHIRFLREHLPHIRIFSMYGLTECKRVSYLPPEDIDERPTSVGKPMDNVEVYVVDAEGRRLDTGTGELVVRGSNVMKGYWGAPAETVQALRPGPLPNEVVLHTGDIFRIDDQGYLYFQNRTDDVIKSRGQKVSPREIENVLHAIPGIQEAAVIPIADPVVGDALKAIVTLNDSAALTVQDILRHCAARLEDFMVPREIEIVATLPRTSSGKIARNALRAGRGSAAEPQMDRGSLEC